MSGPTSTTTAKLSEERVDIASPQAAKEENVSKAEKLEPEKKSARFDDAAGDSGRTSKSEATAEGKPGRRGVGGVFANRTITMKSLLSSLAALAVVVVLAALIWMVVDKSSELNDMKAANADTAHAEKVALDYSTGAAEMSYEDTQGWLKRLTANTTPELGTRLRNAAGQMEQLLRPLQWSSTSSPISAKVTSVEGDTYKVDAFVGITTKNVQTPASGIETTATYKLTIDKDQDWKITAITSNGTNLDADGAAPADGAPAAPQPGAPEAPQPAAPEAPGVPAAPGN
ncbi:hypothetical protein L5G32_13825 [Gordonia sp. HY002]|uniref:hypothetical protein n=1 Tax=Gordonia zhenghanii TaxID=2911516 RepID=UPI001EEFC785|nr:hypothetical protein [Gordonia zhenghanii]MCF8571347.1 hypothetical protein [Gordonia zhenghanii]MCF8601871.1 hypothetical protein [Gordonia zhenghanii]